MNPTRACQIPVQTIDRMFIWTPGKTVGWRPVSANIWQQETLGSRQTASTPPVFVSACHCLGASSCWSRLVFILQISPCSIKSLTPYSISKLEPGVDAVAG